MGISGKFDYSMWYKDSIFGDFIFRRRECAKEKLRKRRKMMREENARVCLLTKLLGWDVFTEQGKAFLIN